MRLIVMGDVHGNIEAFKASVYNAIEKYGKQIDAFVFMGDYCCDFLEGNECVQLIKWVEQTYPVYAISGNRETGMAQKYYDAKRKGEPVSWSLDSTMGAPLLACQKMSDEELAYLSSLPEYLILKAEGVAPLYLQHKMPISEERIEELRNAGITNILTAHTHESHAGTYGGFTLFNSGSIGLTDTGKKGAEYGVLTWKNNQWIMDMQRIDYNYDQAISNVRSNPILMERCKHWGEALIASVETGVNITALYMFEKNRIAREHEEDPTKTDFEHDISFGIGRYGNVSPVSSHLEEQIIVGGENQPGTVLNLQYETDDFKEKRPNAKEEPWMYDVALKNVLSYVAYLQENGLLEGKIHSERTL